METLVVILIVAAAAGFIGQRLFFTLKPAAAAARGGCAGCSGGCADLTNPHAGSIRCSDAVPRDPSRRTRLPILASQNPPGEGTP